MGVFRTIGRGLLLRCPHCGEGRIFRSLFQTNDACASCGKAFMPDAGDWTGGAEMTMILSCAFAVVLYVGLTLWGSFTMMQELLIVMGAVTLVMPLAYRHVKGFWAGVIRAWDGPDPKPNPIRDPEWFTALWEREGR